MQYLYQKIESIFLFELYQKQIADKSVHKT